MVFFLRKYLLLFFLFFLCSDFVAEAGIYMIQYRPLPSSGMMRLTALLPNGPDTAAHGIKKGVKICSCQILVLQVNRRRQRNFALFAERTTKKNYASDISFANRVIEKEKRHMQDYFYDKLEVVGQFSDAIDCRSMYKRLKDKNKSLYLYDILDADIRH